MTDAVKKFEIAFVGQVIPGWKVRNKVRLTWSAQSKVFDIMTNGRPLRGEDSTELASLALFAAGPNGCLILQVQAVLKRLKVWFEGVKVLTKLHSMGRQPGVTRFDTAPVGLHFDIELDTLTKLDEKVRWIDAAKTGA